MGGGFGFGLGFRRFEGISEEVLIGISVLEMGGSRWFLSFSRSRRAADWK